MFLGGQYSRFPRGRDRFGEVSEIWRPLKRCIGDVKWKRTSFCVSQNYVYTPQIPQNHRSLGVPISETHKN